MGGEWETAGDPLSQGSNCRRNETGLVRETRTELGLSLHKPGQEEASRRTGTGSSVCVFLMPCAKEGLHVFFLLEVS